MIACCESDPVIDLAWIMGSAATRGMGETEIGQTT